MNLFKKIFLIITNSNRYKKKVKPYFIFVKKNLSLFSLIETEVPKEVIDNINLLIESQPYKYNVLNDRLYDVKNEIITHNKFVTDLKFISENNDFFSYDKIILNPCSFNIEKLDDLYLAIDYAKKLRNVPKIQIDFNKLKYIIKYYNELCNQYNYLEEFHKLIDLNNYNYIDYNLKKSILENIDTVIDKIDLNHLFYDEYKIPNDFDEYVKNHNQKWIMENINDPLFDEINNKKLDLEQRKAVLSDELSTLVVAGAGSGKTLTICGKIKYLLEHNVSQDDILILSYSKKSADDLQEKVSKISKSITVGTFHKIGLDILKKTKNKSFMIEEQYNYIIEKYFREELKNKPDMLKMILTYYSLYIYSDNYEKKYSNDGEMYEELKKQDFRTLRNQLQSFSNNKETIKKELVKSYEELAIANWYFINGIDYVYESPYEIDVSSLDKRQYMPDFYLPQYGIYHEHYGVNKDNKAVQYNEEEAQNYINSMYWKRQIHKENQTTCIETYSWEFEEGKVFDKLEKSLREKGVKFNPLTNEQVMEAINSIYNGQSFKSFINLIRSFLSLYKHNQIFRDDVNVYVSSVMLEQSKEGLSLYDLFQNVLDMYDNPDSILSLKKLMKRCGVGEENVGLKFAESKAYNDLKIYDAKVLPKINIPAPDGVTNIKYDVDCSLADSLNIDEFVSNIKEL